MTYKVTVLVEKKIWLKNSNEFCLFISWSNFRTAEIGQTLILVKKLYYCKPLVVEHEIDKKCRVSRVVCGVKSSCNIESRVWGLFAPVSLTPYMFVWIVARYSFNIVSSTLKQGPALQICVHWVYCNGDKWKQTSQGERNTIVRFMVTNLLFSHKYTLI